MGSGGSKTVKVKVDFYRDVKTWTVPCDISFGDLKNQIRGEFWIQEFDINLDKKEIKN